MQNIKGKDTRLEVLGKALWKKDIVPEKTIRNHGKPDIAFTKYKICDFL